jgi:hypothetical protein
MYAKYIGLNWHCCLSARYIARLLEKSMKEVTGLGGKCSKVVGVDKTQRTDGIRAGRFSQTLACWLNSYRPASLPGPAYVVWRAGKW